MKWKGFMILISFSLCCSLYSKKYSNTGNWITALMQETGHSINEKKMEHSCIEPKWNWKFPWPTGKLVSNFQCSEVLFNLFFSLCSEITLIRKRICYLFIFVDLKKRMRLNSIHLILTRFEWSTLKHNLHFGLVRCFLLVGLVSFFSLQETIVKMKGYFHTW